MKLQDVLKSHSINEFEIPSNNGLDEIKIDNVAGVGSVPDNQNINYKGLRVLMKPRTFLGLAASLRRPDATSTDHIKQELQSGKGIGAPFLVIDIPTEWENNDFSKPAKVTGHEGRNRMWAVLELEGNDPTEVHLFPKGLRARDLKPEWIDALKAHLIPEKHSVPANGPLFVVGHVDPELDEVYPGQSSGKLKNYIKRKYGGEINCTKAAKVKNDPDASAFYKKRASWYQSLHCKGRKQVRETDCNCPNCK